MSYSLTCPCILTVFQVLVPIRLCKELVSWVCTILAKFYQSISLSLKCECIKNWAGCFDKIMQNSSVSGPMSKSWSWDLTNTQKNFCSQHIFISQLSAKLGLWGRTNVQEFCQSVWLYAKAYEWHVKKSSSTAFPFEDVESFTASWKISLSCTNLLASMRLWLILTLCPIHLPPSVALVICFLFFPQQYSP